MATKFCFLITTAEERAWPVGGSVLFLGAWCCLHGRSERRAAFDIEMLPYHWDDRAQLHRDYLYLRDLHEELLVDLFL